MDKIIKNNLFENIKIIGTSKIIVNYLNQKKFFTLIK